MINKNQTYIMGILNVTPDSFSDGNSYMNIEDAKKQVSKMIKEGANIIDVGGESTRPGADFVSISEEIKRVVPIIKMIKENFDILVSIDTYKSEVANEAVIAGADIINDVWSNKYDKKMLDVVSKHNVYYVAMHNKKEKKYDEGVIKDIILDYKNILKECEKKNIDLNKVILDPGIGFAKGKKENLEVLSNLKKIRKEFSNIMLLGTSRKSFIGTINNIDIPRDRVIGTCVTTVYGLEADFEIFRVHDVKENRQTIEMVKAIKDE